jgi:4-amino-4-deoxy-L-arabinose transferase-like glycosyltransferase
MAVRGNFDGLYGQDAFAYYNYAVGPLRESVLHLSPPPPFFWPPGYPLFVAGLSFVVGTAPLSGQIVSLAAGALVPVLTVLFTREVWPAAGRETSDQDTRALAVPLLAGLFVAFNGQLWQSSAVVMADTTGLAAATAGMWAVARYGRRDAPGWLILAVGALSAAVLTRWIYGLVAIPAAIYVCTRLRHLAGTTALIHGLAATLVGALILGPLLLPGLVGVLRTPDELAPFAGNLQIYTWNPLNALSRSFVTTDGLLSYRLPNGLYYATLPAHWFYFTPLIALFVLPGIWAVIRSRASAPILLVLGWATAVYAFHAGAPWQNFRFGLAYLPPLALLAAVGLEWILRVPASPVRKLALAGVVVGLVAMATGGVVLTQRFIDRKQADLAMVAWVEAQAPSSARLLALGPTLTFQHYSHLETLELYYLDPSQLQVLLAEGRPTLLLADLPNLDQQWRGLAPERNYRWLVETAGLIPVGQWGGYTLMEVRKTAEAA